MAHLSVTLFGNKVIADIIQVRGGGHTELGQALNPIIGILLRRP